MPSFTSVTMDNPSRNQMQQTKAVNSSLRWPRLRCRGNKSTTPVTTPSIPTNLMQKRQNSLAWNKRNSTRISQFICTVSCLPWQLVNVSAVGGYLMKDIFTWELRFSTYIVSWERSWIKFSIAQNSSEIEIITDIPLHLQSTDRRWDDSHRENSFLASCSCVLHRTAIAVNFLYYSYRKLNR